MTYLQALADADAPLSSRRRGLVLVYLIAAVFPLVNTLLLLALFPSLRGFSADAIWALGTAFLLALVLIEALKARSLRQKDRGRLIRAAFLDALLLFVGLLLSVLGLKLALGWGWLFALLGLGSYGLGFLRLAARLPQTPPGLGG